MKDPAVLWYSQDYLVGVIGMTWEEQGRYAYLLNLQHQKGHFDMERVMPDCPPSVRAKFLQDENGLYYNKRMDDETERRAKFAESRRKNGQKGGRPKKQKETYDKPIGYQEEEKESKNNLQETYRLSVAKPTENHAENENENETTDETVNEKSKRREVPDAKEAEQRLTGMRGRIEETKRKWGLT